MADRSGSSRVVLAVACTLFIVHNVLFVVLSVRQFNEEKVLTQQYQQQLHRIQTIKASCPKLGSKTWAAVAALHGDHQLHRRQTDPLLQQMITSQELILENHCANGTGFCTKGPKGDAGPQGITGPMGGSGPAGLQGMRGDSGTAGMQGPPGQNGPRGAAGESAYPGTRGPTGAKGNQGYNEPPGPRGQKGLPGTVGTQGVKGDQGPAGLPGDRGVQGVAGVAGNRGENGTDGRQGEKGGKGPEGFTPAVSSKCTCATKPYVVGSANETISASLTSSLTLNCSVDGTPPPKVTWEKVNSALPLNVEQRGTFLTIPRPSPTDAGVYKCHAGNGLGEVDKYFNVHFVELNCDFERDFCSWQQSQTDNKDWTYNSAGTPTANTGPTTDHTKQNCPTCRGHYVYLETSIGREHDKAELLSPSLGAGKLLCLQFWYHMYGVDVNGLKVFAQYTDGSRAELWSKSGDQGNQWNHGVVSIPPQSRPYKIVIQSSRGKSIEGDIGLDDIHVNDGNCPLTAQDLNCDFERDLCYWKQSKTDQLDLTRQTGPTMTISTGPSTDHTLKTASGHYLYLESSNGTKGDKATVISHLVKANTDICLHVWYHMFGSGMGNIKIYTEQLGFTRQLVWTRTGAQGNQWREAKFTVPLSARPFRIYVETEKGLNPYSDIAIDDIKETPQRCPDPGDRLACDFENLLCQWKQGTQDKMDWKQKTGPQPGGSIGPSTDHTLQSLSGHYLYLDPSLPAASNAVLVSPRLSPSSIYCLDFWYYLDGANAGSIVVRRTQGEVNVEKLLDLKTASGKGWHHEKLGVASYWTNFNLVIEGVRGQASNSYIAIDDVKITSGVCK